MILQNIPQIQMQTTPHPVEKTIAELKKIAIKNKKESWEKIFQLFQLQ